MLKGGTIRVASRDRGERIRGTAILIYLVKKSHNRRGGKKKTCKGIRLLLKRKDEEYFSVNI